MIRTAPAGHNSGAGQLRAFVERIERLDEEISAFNADKSEIYKEAKSTGFNVKVLRKVIAARRMDGAERDEIDALFDAYMTALGEAPESLVRARVENIEEIPAGETGMVLGTGRERPMSVGLHTDGDPEARFETVSLHQEFEPPAFLVKDAKPLRPFCLKPDLCGGYGKNHCHECLKAAGKIEVSA